MVLALLPVFIGTLQASDLLTAAKNLVANREESRNSEGRMHYSTPFYSAPQHSTAVFPRVPQDSITFHRGLRLPSGPEQCYNSYARQSYFKDFTKYEVKASAYPHVFRPDDKLETSAATSFSDCASKCHDHHELDGALFSATQVYKCKAFSFYASGICELYSWYDLTPGFSNVHRSTVSHGFCSDTRTNFAEDYWANAKEAGLRRTERRQRQRQTERRQGE